MYIVHTYESTKYINFVCIVNVSTCKGESANHILMWVRFHLACLNIFVYILKHKNNAIIEFENVLCFSQIHTYAQISCLICCILFSQKFWELILIPTNLSLFNPHTFLRKLNACFGYDVAFQIVSIRAHMIYIYICMYSILLITLDIMNKSKIICHGISFRIFMYELNTIIVFKHM